MCTYNGANYLGAQLASFEAQTYKRWTLYVSDDASTDETREILSIYAERWGKDRLRVFEGPRRGFAENFLSLVKRDEVIGDLFAFSDQDDVWFENKLARSVTAISKFTKETPALYCSRTRLVDADMKFIGESPLFQKPPSFRNALVQSLAGANTMLINKATRQLLAKVPDQAPLVAHDWLTYQLVTGCDGVVVYDSLPCLNYRQHDGNLIGANSTFKARMMGLQRMFSGRFTQWNDANLMVLRQMTAYMAAESCRTLESFDKARKGSLLGRLSFLYRSKVYRQTPQGNLSMLLATLLGRF